MNCGSCKRPITTGEDESCWFCDNYLCYYCWEYCGHCGHEEADAINRASLLTSWEGRHNLIKALHPGMEMLTPEPKAEEPN